LKRNKKQFSKVLEKIKSKNKQIEPFKPQPPLNVELEFTDSTMMDVAELVPNVKRIDGNIVGYTA